MGAGRALDRGRHCVEVSTTSAPHQAAAEAGGSATEVAINAEATILVGGTAG